MSTFACNLNAISATDRPRYNDLVNRVRVAIRDRTEASNGYVFLLDSTRVTLPEVAEWISMERRCCPFLTLQLHVSGEEENWILTLSGTEGVKPLLEATFPVGISTPSR